MWGALATKSPSLSKRAQEKSSLSLIFTEELVFCNVIPICSAIDLNRLLNISSITGSAEVGILSSDLLLISTDFSVVLVLLKMRLFLAVNSASQPGSIILVPVFSIINAGLLILSPTCKFSRR